MAEEFGKLVLGKLFKKLHFFHNSPAILASLFKREK